MVADATKSGMDPAAGGRARAKALTKEQRSEIARQAARARWGSTGKVKQAICGSPDHPLRIGDIEIACYVLEDARRVLSQRGVQAGVGFSRSAAKGGARRLVHFLESLEKKDLDTKGLTARAREVIKFVPAHGGQTALGYEATILPDFCRVVLEARREGVLLRQQEGLAIQCEILLAGLANVGIIALVDEATGYQDIRARDALAKILEKFVAKELQPWVKTFPAEFYKHLYRVRGLEFPKDSNRHPRYFGHLTNDIVYSRLAPGVLDELKRDTPRTPSGRHAQQLHRRLTEDVGHPKLREHLASATTLLKISDFDDWNGFKRLLDRAHPRYNETIPLTLEEPNFDEPDGD